MLPKHLMMWVTAPLPLAWWRAMWSALSRVMFPASNQPADTGFRSRSSHPLPTASRTTSFHCWSLASPLQLGITSPSIQRPKPDQHTKALLVVENNWEPYGVRGCLLMMHTFCKSEEECYNSYWFTNHPNILFLRNYLKNCMIKNRSSWFNNLGKLIKKYHPWYFILSEVLITLNISLSYKMFMKPADVWAIFKWFKHAKSHC